MSKNNSLDSFVKNRKVIIAAGVFMSAMILLMLANALGFRPGGGDEKLQQAELKIWGLWDDSSLIEKYISEFRKQYSSINIEYRKQIGRAHV